MEGKPLAMICHGVVGLQHASMAMYNAWCDRVPVIVMGGNIMEADKRAPGAEWPHSAIDPAALTRDFVKWDDQPASLQHFAESAVRAYKISITPPMAPVMLSLDQELQENPIENRDRLRIPKFTPATPPQADDAALAQLAKMLVAAENPVILCDRMARTPAGMPRLVELAETLQCAVIDNYGRMNFPSRHPLNQSFRRSILSQADLILAMEVNDIWGSLSDFHDRIVRTSEPRYKKTAKIVTLGTRGLYLKANYQDFGRYQDVDLDITGDAEASLPALTEQVKRLVDEGRKAAFAPAARSSRPPSSPPSSRPSSTPRSAGTRARSPRRGCAPNSTARSRMRTGRWSEPRSASHGRIAYGISPSRISGTASPAAAVSATPCRPRSEPRSPTNGTDD